MKKNSKSKILTATTFLTFTSMQFSSVPFFEPFVDESTGIQDVRTIEDISGVSSNYSGETSVPSLIASFDDEKEIISKMEMMMVEEFPDSRLEKWIKEQLTSEKTMLNVLEYIDVNENDNWLIMLSKLYSTLIPNRSAQIVSKLIKECFDSKDNSTVSFGIDLLSLHSSYPELKGFFQSQFSHPYLKRKMSSLIKEVLL